MIKFQHRIALIISAVVFCFLQGFSQQTLTTAVKLGEPAPAFKTSYWIRGKPVARFEKDQVYVLEFWATWCTYCIQAMPHLSELNTKYAGKVRFIGIDVMEPAVWGQDPIEPNKPKVAKFISEGAGKVMNYDLCRDTKDDFMKKNWVTAQGLYGMGGTGIPFTAIVKDGNVVWIGHPYAEGAFEKALEQVVNNTYDVQEFITACKNKIDAMATAAKEGEARRAAATKVPALDAMNKAYDNKDYALALKEVYAAIKKDNSLYRSTFITRLNAFKGLLPEKPAEAFSLIQLEQEHIASTNDTAKIFLKDLATTFGRQEGLDKKHYDFAVETLKKVPEERVIQVRYLQGLAYAYYHQGDKVMSAKIMQNLIDRTKAIGQNPAEYEQMLANLTVK